MTEMNPTASVNKEVLDNVIYERQKLSISKWAEQDIKPEAVFTYWDIQYRSVQAAVDRFGNDVVLALINSSISSALRNKARAQLPASDNIAEDYAKFIELHQSKIDLLSKEDAEKYTPGSREKTSPQSLFKLSAEYMSEAAEAKKAGNIDEARRLIKLAKEAHDQAKALAAQKTFKVASDLTELL